MSNANNKDSKVDQIPTSKTQSRPSVEDAMKAPERVSLRKQRVFSADRREGYTRRYVNDLPGRIQAFLLAGWALVADTKLEKTHDGLAQVESQLGSSIRRMVNKDPNAPCHYAYLMEIPTELYDEDQLEQQKEIDEKEAAFDPTGLHKKSGMYGTIDRK